MFGMNTSVLGLISTIMRWLGKVIAIAVLSMILSLIFGTIAIEMVSLGPNFHYIFFVVPILSIFLAIVWERIPGRRQNSGNSSEPKFVTSIKNWSKSEDPEKGLNGYKWKFVILCALAIITVPVLSMTPSLWERMARSRDAEAALRSFTPTYPPNADLKRLERTLAEFERSRRSISDELSVPKEISPITLLLFNDSNDYRNARNLSWSGGFTECIESGVTIGVPLEEASNVFDEDPHSGAPMHEMLHAMMCQRLGPTNFFSVQSWFHEGVAQLYGNADMSRLRYRIINRTMLWMKRDQLIPPERFCYYRQEGSSAEITLFYSTSWEFVRSLERGYKRSTLIAIIDDVAAGVPFDKSLVDRLGGSCTDLYAKWSESL